MRLRRQDSGGSAACEFGGTIDQGKTRLDLWERGNFRHNRGLRRGYRLRGARTRDVHRQLGYHQRPRPGREVPAFGRYLPLASSRPPLPAFQLVAMRSRYGRRSAACQFDPALNCTLRSPSSFATRPALRGHPARERGRIKTGNRCPGLGDPSRLLPHLRCQRFCYGRPGPAGVEPLVQKAKKT